MAQFTGEQKKERARMAKRAFDLRKKAKKTELTPEEQGEIDAWNALKTRGKPRNSESSVTPDSVVDAAPSPATPTESGAFVTPKAEDSSLESSRVEAHDAQRKAAGDGSATPPPPPPPPPPRTDYSSASSSSDWRAKYRKSAESREELCLQAGSVVASLMAKMSADIKALGGEPILSAKAIEDDILPHCVLAADEVLPKKLTVDSRVVVVGSFGALLTQRWIWTRNAKQKEQERNNDGYVNPSNGRTHHASEHVPDDAIVVYDAREDGDDNDDAMSEAPACAPSAADAYW